MSKIRLHGTSSGYTDIAPTAAAGNNTLTAPTGTGTLVAEDSNGDISVNLGIVHTGDTDTKIKFPAANTITAETGGSEALRIDSAGRVQIGNTSSIVGGRVELHRASAGTWITINESSDSGSGPALYLNRTRGSDLSSPTAATSGNWLGNVYFGSYDTNSYEQGAKISAAADSNWADGDCPARLMFYTTPDGSTTPTERLRIDSSGNLTAVNTTSGGTTGVTLKVGASAASGTNSGTIIINNGGLGNASLQFDYENSAARAKIWVYRSDQQLRFDTSGSERFRINSNSLITGTSTVLDGDFDTIRLNNSSSHVGTVLRTSGGGGNAQNNEYCWLFHRMGTDGQLVKFNHAGSEEGNISVSGSTVSYNGGHLSRWSQLVGISTNIKSDRPTIYQGTVMSNLDAMCEWPGEENQQLNKTKVSDTVGDKDVAGVFWTWDDDDDVYTNDFYVAMTGDMVIRVAASTTVARGDLLESAGDGTAKPQSDDIVRSKTVAKITSTTSTATYGDGSKAYPCVLMAC